MIKTLEDVQALSGVEVLEHLDLQVAIPLGAGLQRQGDVGFLPAGLAGRVASSLPGTPVDVPPAGVPLVSSGQGGHTHLLVADGRVGWCPVRTGEIGDVGVIVVPEGSAAYVIHPEHGAMGFAPGRYLVRRQVEMADELRIVAD